MKGFIELIDVYKEYNLGLTRVTALKKINLKIKKGEFIGIMGPSGAGKSTLMNIIGLLDKPTRVIVKLGKYDSKSLTDYELSRIRGKEIGFVFQSFNLLNAFNTIENVELPLSFQGVPEKIRKKRAAELLEKVGLSHRFNHKPNELSGGEMQRVSIARALVNDPQVIIADEPTGNLDSKSVENVMKLLTELNKEGKTIIVVSHNKNLDKYFSKIEYLSDGEIVKEVPLLKVADYRK